MTQVYTTKVSGGHTVATIVNWRKTPKKNFKFHLKDIGVIARDDQIIEIWNLWAHKTLGEFKVADIERFIVERIPGHGNRTLKFIVKDKPSSTYVAEAPNTRLTVFVE